MSKKYELVRLFDIIIQLVILLSLLYSYTMILWAVFIGAIWQLGSYWIIRITNRSEQNDSRNVYWFIARIIIVIFISGLFFTFTGIISSTAVIGILGYILLLVSFIGGVILYICYLLICIKELME